MDKPPIADDLEEIQKILDSAQTVYAFNAPFDFAFLGALGLRIPSGSGHDTMREYGRKFHATDFIKLSKAAQEIGYSYHQHDAWADAYATMFVQRRVDAARPSKRPHVQPREVVVGEAVSDLTGVVERAIAYKEAHPDNGEKIRRPRPAKRKTAEPTPPPEPLSVKAFTCLMLILAVLIVLTFIAPWLLILDILLALICWTSHPKREKNEPAHAKK